MVTKVVENGVAYPKCTAAGHTDGQTDRTFTGKFDYYRPLRYESYAA